MVGIVSLGGAAFAVDLGPEIVVTGEAGGQQFPDVAFGNNEYLVVWEVEDYDFELFDVYGRMLDGDGQPVGDPFPIFADPDIDEQAPEIAYNPQDNQFIVVARESAQNEAFAQLVAGGQLLGERIPLGRSEGPTFFDPAARARVVSVAYKPSGNEWFLGIMSNSSAGMDFLSSDGEPVGQAITGLGSGGNPAVAWSSISDVGILAYEDRESRNTGAENLSAFLVRADGSLVNEQALFIRDQDFAEESPRVAYNIDDDQFLLVWDERIGFDTGRDSGTDTMGQIVATDGTLIGDVIPIEPSTPYTLRQDVAYSPQAGHYLVVWKGDDNNSFAFADINGRFVGRDGSLLGEKFIIFDDGDDATDDGTSERYYDESKLPAIAANDSGAFLVVWEEAGTNREPEDRDIHARFVSMPGSGVGSWSLFD